VLGHSTQAYYAWLADPISPREFEDAYLTNALIDAHEDDPEFGYRFLADEVEPAGHQVGERRVWWLRSQQKLWSTTVRKGRRGSGKRPGPAVHDDLVQRQFSAAEPDRVWLTDITEHATSQGKIYCCAIKDVFSNRIVCYALDERMTAQLAVSALRAAIARRRPALCGSLRPRIAISSSKLPGGPHSCRSERLDGSSGLSRGQRRDGVLLQPAPEERPQQAPLDLTRRAAQRHRVLDRTHLQPSTPTTLPRPAHTCRIRASVTPQPDHAAA